MIYKLNGWIQQNTWHSSSKQIIYRNIQAHSNHTHTQTRAPARMKLRGRFVRYGIHIFMCICQMILLYVSKKKCLLLLLLLSCVLYLPCVVDKGNIIICCWTQLNRSRCTESIKSLHFSILRMFSFIHHMMMDCAKQQKKKPKVGKKRNGKFQFAHKRDSKTIQCLTKLQASTLNATLFAKREKSWQRNEKRRKFICDNVYFIK